MEMPKTVQKSRIGRSASIAPLLSKPQQPFEVAVLEDPDQDAEGGGDREGVDDHGLHREEDAPQQQKEDRRR